MKPVVAYVLALIFVLSSYTGTAYADMDTANPADSGFLWLVNQTNRLDAAYIPPQLVEYKGHQMHPAVLEAFEQMLAAMREEGAGTVYIQSAYRSYSRQQFLFRNKVNQFRSLGYDEAAAIERTARSLAHPGASEHQTGLAIDVTQNGRLTQAFGDTRAGKWIAENCHRFGFIVRYPKDKTAITGIIYEPWHLRYVGNPHASFMKEQNLCLEEYMDYLATYKLYAYWDEDKNYFLVSLNQIPGQNTRRQLIDTSNDRAGEDASVIYTTWQQAVSTASP